VIPLLQIQNLSVQISAAGAAKHRPVSILRGIDLAVAKGQVMGIVGESGCGKTMTVLAVLGLLPEGARIGSGKILFQNQDITALSPREREAIRGKKITMVFQEPMSSLNPLLSIGEQMREILYRHEGLRGRANREKCLALLDAVHIPSPARLYDNYPFRLSGGMRQRVLIAMAIACEPELIIADEPTTALDVTTQAQILDLFDDIRRRINASFIFVSHDLGVISEIADRTAVLYAGYVVEECSTAQLFEQPLHPYTIGLMRSRIGRRATARDGGPSARDGGPTARDGGPTARFSGPTARISGLYSIPGAVPVPGEAIDGCPFAPRCEHRAEACSAGVPPLHEQSAGHTLRCLRYSRGQ
jgi:oligopeptide/dipeptide ABC transporter ATP-binding protein